VRLYSPEGKLLRQLNGSQVPGASFTRPMGIAVLPGAVVVSDLEGRVVKALLPKT
jgi:hypothetical protein